MKINILGLVFSIEKASKSIIPDISDDDKKAIISEEMDKKQALDEIENDYKKSQLLSY